MHEENLNDTILHLLYEVLNYSQNCCKPFVNCSTSYPNTTFYPNTHYLLLAAGSKYPIRGSEEIMKKKLHGSSDSPVQSNLKYGCDVALADRICNYNRRFAEHAGAFRNVHFDLFFVLFFILFVILFCNLFDLSTSECKAEINCC